MKNRPNNPYLLIGTYSNVDEENIYVYQFDMESGLVEYVSSLSGVSNPSYLVVSQDGSRVYAVSEDDTMDDRANTLAFDRTTGQLSFLNSKPTLGEAPCYINIDKDDRFVVTANYNGQTVSVFPLDEKGELMKSRQTMLEKGSGPDPIRQKTPHIHSVVFSPDGKYLFAADLGTDKIHKYNVVQQVVEDQFLSPGKPQHIELEPGSGPRHIVFHPNTKWMYVINELSGKVAAFTYNDGILEAFQYIVADSLGARGSGDIHISPDGKFLYCSNRLEGDGLAIFSIDPSSGKLSHVGYQPTAIHPRNFLITPNGKYLLVACRDSDAVQIFSIDTETGFLKDTQNDIRVNKPVCVKLVQ